MINPENPRLLADERSALDAETTLAREEQRLWQRLESATGDALDKRGATLSARIASLGSSPDVPAADLARARGIALAAAQPDAVVAQAERAAALVARRSALQGRELALKALTTTLTAVETARAHRQKELELAESLVTAAESATRKAAENRKKDTDEQAKKAAADAAKAEADRKAAAAASQFAARTEPAMRPYDPTAGKTDPGSPAGGMEMKTEPGVPMPVIPPAKAAPLPVAVTAKSAIGPTGTAPSIGPVPTAKGKGSAKTAAPEPALAPGARKVSRRRRVKLAPPPRKLEFEVAIHGDNNFYTGFDSSISAGGVFVSSLETLPQGHELEIEISLEGHKIETRARVEFVRLDNAANPECTQGAGLKMVNLPRDAQTAIESFFAIRAPMFYLQP